MNTQERKQSFVERRDAALIARLEELIEEADGQEKVQLAARLKAAPNFHLYSSELKQQKIRKVSYFIHQLYFAYCQQKLEQQDEHRDYYLTVIQREESRNQLSADAQPIHELARQIKSSLIQHNNAAKSWSSPWIFWLGNVLGYNWQESKTQLAHFKEIQGYLSQNDIRNFKTCHELIEKLQITISQKTFVRWFWLSSNYHNGLVQLHQQLTVLESKIQAQLAPVVIPSSQGESSERSAVWVKDRTNNVSLGTSRFTLHQSGLGGVGQEKDAVEEEALDKDPMRMALR